MKSSDSGRELKAIEATHVRKQAQVRLQDAINLLQRSAYDMEVYAEKLEAAQDDKERAQVVNWAINHLVCNILPNFRIDLLACSQADLSALGK
jgi:hypothetical protein